MQLRQRDLKENLIYLLLWLVLFLAPALSMVIRSYSDSNSGSFDWPELLHLWKFYAVYFVIFLVHNFVLAPLLVNKNRRGLYLATTACLVAVVMVYNCMSKPQMRAPRPPHHQEAPPPAPHQEAARPAPHFSTGGGHPEKPDGPGVAGERPSGPMPKGARPSERPMPFPFGPGDVVNTVFLILLLGMNLGVKLFFKGERDKQELQELQRKNLEQQLEYLKYQINPHFFMNTLNNIHALVDIDPEQAKTTIVDLSRLMRYVLYEGSEATVPLSRDIDFLGNYIKLMRLRYSDRVDISTHFPTTIPDLQIPPMLLITFVENAFKHGVSYQQQSFVSIGIELAGQRLHFLCKNSKPNGQTRSEGQGAKSKGQGSRFKVQGSKSEVQGSKPESETSDNAAPREGGVGLTNVQQRLDLIFADDYKLNISDGDDTYSVSLDIPLTRITQTPAKKND